MLWELIKKYWILIGGIITALTVSILSSFESTIIQLVSNIIMLSLVSLGLFNTIDQEIYKRKHKKTVIDNVVDHLGPVKAIRMAKHPTKDGEELGKVLLRLWKEIKKIMEKLKTFWSKFKGYMLTAALAVLTLIEFCGGFINELCGGVLVIGSVEVVPLVTLAATTVVGIVSNGYTKEQRAAIKTLLNTTKDNKEKVDPEVKAQLKVKLKESEAKLKEHQTNKANLEAKLKTLNTNLATAKSNYDAKVKMFNMNPALATNTEVNEARAGVSKVEGEITSVKTELEKVNALITTTTTMINAIKNQL